MKLSSNIYFGSVWKSVVSDCLQVVAKKLEEQLLPPQKCFALILFTFSFYLEYHLDMNVHTCTGNPIVFFFSVFCGYFSDMSTNRIFLKSKILCWILKITNIKLKALSKSLKLNAHLHLNGFFKFYACSWSDNRSDSGNGEN